LQSAAFLCSDYFVRGVSRGNGGGGGTGGVGIGSGERTVSLLRLVVSCIVPLTDDPAATCRISLVFAPGVSLVSLSGLLRQVPGWALLSVWFRLPDLGCWVPGLPSALASTLDSIAANAANNIIRFIIMMLWNIDGSPYTFRLNMTLATSLIFLPMKQKKYATGERKMLIQ